MAKSEAVRLLPGGEVSRSARGSEALFHLVRLWGPRRRRGRWRLMGAVREASVTLGSYLPGSGEEGLWSHRFPRSL